jgi:hypothetical protein
VVVTVVFEIPDPAMGIHGKRMDYGKREQLGWKKVRRWRRWRVG